MQNGQYRTWDYMHPFGPHSVNHEWVRALSISFKKKPRTANDSRTLKEKWDEFKRRTNWELSTEKVSSDAQHATAVKID